MDIPDAKLLGALMDELTKRKVLIFKAGDLVIQFAPTMPTFDEPEVSPAVTAGGWKRQATLEDESFHG